MSVSVAVAGASGYAGGEVVRLLEQHAELELKTVTANTNAGLRLGDLHPQLGGYGDLVLQQTSREVLAGHQVVFLALPHGASAAIAAELHEVPLLVDCGADHRLESAADWASFYAGPHAGAWTYGVPELPLRSEAGLMKQRERLRGASRVAAPGCNASAVALAYAPGVAAALLDVSDLVAVLAVGTSGAGRTLKPELLASEVLGSASVYGVGGTHRHIPEALQSLRWVGAENARLTFQPVLVPMSRGILAVSTARVREGVTEAELFHAWNDAYRDERFVRVLPSGSMPRSGDSTGSNVLSLGLAFDPRAGRVTVVAGMDNLVKGTAGAAIQSANIALGLPEEMGLPTVGVAP